MKATGFYDQTEKKWYWQDVSWTKDENTGMYVSNRIYPDEFWNRKWLSKKNNTAGVILLKKHKDSFKILVVQCYHNKFGFPKGTCDSYETFEDAAKRELKEELGIILDFDLKSIPNTHIIENKHPNQNLKKIRNSAQVRKVKFFVLMVPEDFEINSFPSKGLGDVEITKFGWIDINKLNNYEISHLAKQTYNQLQEIIKIK